MLNFLYIKPTDIEKNALTEKITHILQTLSNPPPNWIAVQVAFAMQEISVSDDIAKDIANYLSPQNATALMTKIPTVAQHILEKKPRTLKPNITFIGNNILIFSGVLWGKTYPITFLATFASLQLAAKYWDLPSLSMISNRNMFEHMPNVSPGLLLSRDMMLSAVALSYAPTVSIVGAANKGLKDFLTSHQYSTLYLIPFNIAHGGINWYLGEHSPCALIEHYLPQWVNDYGPGVYAIAPLTVFLYQHKSTIMQTLNHCSSPTINWLWNRDRNRQAQTSMTSSSEASSQLRQSPAR